MGSQGVALCACNWASSKARVSSEKSSLNLNLWKLRLKLYHSSVILYGGVWNIYWSKTFQMTCVWMFLICLGFWNYWREVGSSVLHPCISGHYFLFDLLAGLNIKCFPSHTFNLSPCSPELLLCLIQPASSQCKGTHFQSLIFYVDHTYCWRIILAPSFCMEIRSQAWPS